MNGVHHGSPRVVVHTWPRPMKEREKGGKRGRKKTLIVMVDDPNDHDHEKFISFFKSLGHT